MKPSLRISYTAVFLMAVACSNEKKFDTRPERPETLTEEITVVPLEDALATLQDFMHDAYPENVTKAGAFEDLIASVDTHYSKSVLTKAGTPIEDAYVVNFVDDGGFAVLGANNKVGDIIAVTEGGSIKVEDIDSAYEAPSDEEILFYDEDGNRHTSFYCAEDDDYYSAGNFLLPVLIYNGINSNNDGHDGITGSGPNGSGLRVVAPMIKTKWSQGQYHESGVYNKYCKKNGECVYAGCSTTALAQIIAYNQFPPKIGGVELDYSNMTGYPYADYLNDNYQEHVSLLYGNIFNNVSKSIFGKSGTLITPEQIKRRMISYGYSNVKKTIISEITTYTIYDISSMLSQGKPVFFSAIAHLATGHSWVIDGAKYSSGGSYLLHFNFGWRNQCNGYFYTSCLNPVKAYEYDPGAENFNYDEFNDLYSWHFRMITYNK